MAVSKLFGKRHQIVLDSLLNDWWAQGPPVCFLEGFPGVGKSNAITPLLRQRLADQGVKVVAIEVPQPGGTQFADLLLDLGQELALVGQEELAEAVDRFGNAREVALALLRVLQQPILIIWDEFQRLLGKKTGRPVEPLASLLARLGRNVEWRGRLLLLTNRSPRRGSWADPHRFESLGSLDAEDGRAFLDHMLESGGREKEIQPDARDDIVSWVGGNPRALQLVVAALASEPLENLIGLAPEAWELRHRHVAPALLRDLENELLRKVVEDLDPPTQRFFLLSSVLRKPVKRDGLDRFAPDDAPPEVLRRTLADRFFLSHDRGWYILQPLAREVGRGILASSERDWRLAHSIAGSYFARHFLAKRVVGGGRLGGDFVEARYHLSQAGRQADIEPIVRRFEGYIRSEISLTTPVPKEPAQLDERIATLSALLEKKGPKGLEYHLARCLVSRGRGRDTERALEHIRRASGPQAPAQTWVFRAELEAKLHGADSALATLRDGLRALKPGSNAFSLYQKGGELLATDNRPSEAVAFIIQGIRKVPADKSAVSLYQAAGELLAGEGKAGEAVELLREGIRKVPADKSAVSLYQAAGELLAGEGKAGEAVELLREGIRKVPADKNVFSLYQAAGELLAGEGKAGEAVELLREGIRKVPADKNVFSLYQAAGELLAGEGKAGEAVELLREGIRKVPADKSAVSLYQAAGELLAGDGKVWEAVELLREGIRKVPADKSAVSLYQAAGELLAGEGKAGEAVELLREGIRKVPADKNVLSLYQAAGELLAGEGKAGEAVELLREGIRKVPADKNVFSLYQAAGEILFRAGQVETAVDLLKEGLRSIPREFGRYRIGEGLLYNCLGLRRDGLLKAAIEETGAGALDAPQMALAEVFRLQVAEEWGGAAGRAQQARKGFPRYLALAIQEALSWLAAGRNENAASALESFSFRQGEGIPSTWLASFVALRNDEEIRARELFGVYLGRRLEDAEPFSERDLLREWDSEIPYSALHPAYYHPTLPGYLTGLSRSVTRPPGSGPVLESLTSQARRTGPRQDVDGLAILAVATEWFSRHGGLSTLNRELCVALAESGQRVACLLPSATREEVEHARPRGVVLVEAPHTGGSDSFASLVRRPRLPPGYRPDVVIGHGRITGPAAVSQVEDSFHDARRIHLMHMAPGEIEWYKEAPGAAVRAEGREREELRLCRRASLVGAIGPRLAREVGNLLVSLDTAPPLVRLDPGLLPESPNSGPPPGVHVLVIGRAEDLRLKGLDIAAAATAQVRVLGESDSEPKPVLIVRGAPPGTGDALREELRALAGSPGLEIRVREYTDDEKRLSEDLRRASLVLMPSRAEGFGLVGLEAISSGVPILVSDRSGLGELLREKMGQGAARFVVPVIDELETDAPVWAQAIARCLRDRGAAFSQAAAVLTQLSASLSWKDMAARLLRALPGNQLSRTVSPMIR